MATARKKSFRWSTVVGAFVLFLAVTFVVVWRRSAGVEAGRKMAQLERQRRELETEIKSLEHDIREASSNRVVVKRAEQLLGMRVATERQVHTIAAPRLQQSAADAAAGRAR